MQDFDGIKVLSLPGLTHRPRSNRGAESFMVRLSISHSRRSRAVICILRL